MNRYVPDYPGADQRARLGEPLLAAEVDIIRRLAAGAYDQEIAVVWGISMRTYRRYAVAAMRKLGARTRAHAVMLAAARHLIELPPNLEDGVPLHEIRISVP